MGNTADVRRSVYALSHRAQDTTDLFRRTVQTLRRAMPVDRWCALTLDPATLLPTGGVHDEGVPLEHMPRLLELEHLTPEGDGIGELAQRSEPVGLLSRRDPASSARYREIVTPSGFADELRVALRSDGRTWGGLILFRESGHFEAADADLLRDVSVFVGAAIRRSLVAHAGTDVTEAVGPGVIILDGARLDAMTPAASRLIEELGEVGHVGPDGLPPTVLALAERARLAARGQMTTTLARARTRSGRWLLLHAAALDDEARRVAVTLEPADPIKLAPLVMEAYGLSGREQEVVALLLRGRSTREISETLFLSAHTVQDHLKSIFTKVGVRSRRELVSVFLFRHYLPEVEAGSAPSAHGWFEGP